MTARGAIRRRGTVLGLVLSLVAVGAVFAAPELLGPADQPTVPAVRVDPPDRSVVIGDSAIAALRWVPRADTAVLDFEHTLDLESCRRLYYRSCRGRENRVPPTLVEALDFHGHKYTTLVVATGYNDGASGFKASFEAVVESARQRGYQRIVWWTLRSDVDYVAPGSVANHLTYAITNQIVASELATGEYPEVVLADWGSYTADRPEWFVTDGVHYRSIGAWGAADYLSRKMAYLDGRSCPVPTAPHIETEDPCPDPDITGPVADLEALYPIGEDGVLCYEVGPDRTFECRDDTHVIRIERELEIGMEGPDVGALQTRLIRLGLLLNSFAGEEFGVVTRGAVEAFQRSESVAVTGVADTATLDLLGFDTSGIDVPSP